MKEIEPGHFNFLYVAIDIWALLLNELSDWAATVNQFAPYALVLAIVLLVLVMHLLQRRHNRSIGNERD